MPKPRVPLGSRWPIPCVTARRLTLLLLGLSVLAITLIAALTSAVPLSPSLSVYDTKIAVPRIGDIQAAVPRLGDSLSKSALNPFRQSAHPPPSQQNDRYAGSWWWADWKWLSVPFSSSVTLDPQRTLLPHLKTRQPIYCYYDATLKKTRDEKDAESELLLTWRRAWWAQGFRPVILSASEAINNPSYDGLQRLDMDPHVRLDLMRLLAWESMGGGILSHYTLLPTVPSEHPMLSYLRRGEYPQLTRWSALDDALFTGHKDAVGKAIRDMTEPAALEEIKSGLVGAPDGVFVIDEAPMPLASYSQHVISSKYDKVAAVLEQDRAQGLRDLNALINTHLHVAWQNRFPHGIDVVKPHPEHTTTMVADALQLARRLAFCADSPMPASCPPNLPKCAPCVAALPMRVSTPARFYNSSSIFSIGIVPHPWTMALLANLRESIDVSWIRRESPRDPWITAVTHALLGGGVSGSRRVVALKEAVGGEHATAHSLWLIAENDMPADMGWYFGFAIPTRPLDDGKSLSPVPADRLPKKDDEMPEWGNGPVATEEDLAREPPLLARARNVVAQTKSSGETRLRASLEAWNMADTEIWRFVRDFEARRVMVRSGWEREEARYSSGSGTEKGRSAWNRWQDRRGDDDKPS